MTMPIDEHVGLSNRSITKGTRIGWFITALFFLALYFNEFNGMYKGWIRPESYYSHGFLIPFISGYFVWKKRDRLAALPIEPSSLGFVVMIFTSIFMMVCDFLSLRVFMQVSFIPMLAGIILACFGRRHLRELAFPLFFLVFMVPMPESITSSVSLRIKLLATEGAVQLARLCTLPMLRDGSYVHFNGDKLLVGEVCGGLRSLIALLAFGTIMAYVSKARLWARIALLGIAPVVAIIANLFRIFFLCVVGYYWGSDSATGKVHDISGVLIFAVAFAMFLAIESLLRYLAPARERTL